MKRLGNVRKPGECATIAFRFCEPFHNFVGAGPLSLKAHHTPPKRMTAMNEALHNNENPMAAEIDDAREAELSMEEACLEIARHPNVSG